MTRIFGASLGERSVEILFVSQQFAAGASQYLTSNIKAA
jgi:hypothetical protein